MNGQDVTLSRLEDQINWYDGRSRMNQRLFKWLKSIEILAAAVVPLFAGLRLPPILTGALAVIVIVLEGFQQVHQYYSNWIRYRSTCEELKHEKFLYLGKAGPYVTAENPQVLLAERVEALISHEHAKWIRVSERAARAKGLERNDVSQKA